jgi:hypothetical protein
LELSSSGHNSDLKTIYDVFAKNPARSKISSFLLKTKKPTNVDPRACHYISVVAKIQLKSQQVQNPITISSQSDENEIKEYHQETSRDFFNKCLIQQSFEPIAKALMKGFSEIKSLYYPSLKSIVIGKENKNENELELKVYENSVVFKNTYNPEHIIVAHRDYFSVNIIYHEIDVQRRLKNLFYVDDDQKLKILKIIHRVHGSPEDIIYENVGDIEMEFYIKFKYGWSVISKQNAFTGLGG